MFTFLYPVLGPLFPSSFIFHDGRWMTRDEFNDHVESYEYHLYVEYLEEKVRRLSRR